MDIRVTGLILVVLGLAMMAIQLLGIWPLKQVSSIVAVLNILIAAVDLVERRYVTAGISTLAATYYLWVWWRNGGGDDTKRRLRSAWKKFEPTRRSAPQEG